MLKLMGILQDYVLYEGLIHSTEIETAVDHLQRWSVVGEKLIIKKTPKNTINLNVKIGETINEREFDNLYKLINNLGWFISEYVVNEKHLKSQKFELNKFKENIKKFKLISLSLEAKYDLELDKYNIENLFHVTALKNKEKINKIGLVPRSLSKIGYHPERIYLTKYEADAIALAETFSDDKTKDFVIYKIDVDGLRKNNNGIRFFKDPNLGSGIYTLSNIPPKYIKEYKIFSV